jgi:CubicO group peptidase (beta-lactamase class C family)
MLKKFINSFITTLIPTTIASTEPIFANSTHSHTYLPPTFIDCDRLAKCQTLFPDIDEMYKDYAEKNHIPGYVYGVMLDGKLVHSGCGGFIDLDRKIPTTTHSLFRIASMTKSFTAMAILMLRDEGKLKLENPVSLYIPEILNYQLTKDTPVITIRDLLMHSAGFPTDDPWADRKLNETEEDFINLLKKGLHFSNIPGTAYEYSNLGYTMLGYIIQKVTGISYEKFIAERIWLPLEMKEASWNFKEVEPTQLVHGYRWIDENWKEEELLQNGVFGAMGGILTSIESFSQYAALHLSAWPPRDDEETGPIKRSSLREMHQPWKFRNLVLDKHPDGRDRVLSSGYGYGLNWACDNQGKVFVGHNGGLPGFGSNWYIMPEYGLGVIFFANVTYAPTGKLNLDVLDTLVLKAHLQPRELPASYLLKERQSELIKFLPDWKNVLESPIFAPNFFLDNSVDSLKKETQLLFSKAGKILSVGTIIPENQLRGHFIIKGEKIDLYIHFALTPENPSLIQEFHIKEK